MSSFEAQVPSFEAQSNRIFRVTFFSYKKAGIKQGRIGAAHRRNNPILPKLPKAVLMWVIEVMSGGIALDSK
ncbi:hypothetical protein [uncultured Nostoc sp.]|uniref:hypothetical protein n=1 Tax=uncultured Nostoc sp. TaxID=340711 RepID=UPI0035C9F0E3